MAFVGRVEQGQQHGKSGGDVGADGGNELRDEPHEDGQRYREGQPEDGHHGKGEQRGDGRQEHTGVQVATGLLDGHVPAPQHLALSSGPHHREHRPAHPRPVRDQVEGEQGHGEYLEDGAHETRPQDPAGSPPRWRPSRPACFSNCCDSDEAATSEMEVPNHRWSNGSILATQPGMARISACSSCTSRGTMAATITTTSTAVTSITTMSGETPLPPVPSQPVDGGLQREGGEQRHHQRPDEAGQPAYARRRGPASQVWSVQAGPAGAAPTEASWFPASPGAAARTGAGQISSAGGGNAAVCLGAAFAQPHASSPSVRRSPRLSPASEPPRRCRRRTGDESALRGDEEDRRHQDDHHDGDDEEHQRSGV